MITGFESTLRMAPKNGLYWLDSKLPDDALRRIAEELDYSFYYINGSTITDHSSFFAALTHAFDWPHWAKGNWDAIFDIMTEPAYYGPHKKGVILFDQCNNLAKGDIDSFKIVVDILRDIPARFDTYLQYPTWNEGPFQIYTLLRGEDSGLEGLPGKHFPIPTFIEI